MNAADVKREVEHAIGCEDSTAPSAFCPTGDGYETKVINFRFQTGTIDHVKVEHVLAHAFTADVLRDVHLSVADAPKSRLFWRKPPEFTVAEEFSNDGEFHDISDRFYKPEGQPAPKAAFDQAPRKTGHSIAKMRARYVITDKPKIAAHG